MIKDSVLYVDNYSFLDDKVKQGLQYLLSTDFSAVEDGKYDISDDMYVNIQSYTTKVDADYEAHRKYIDIQYLISGSEKIGIADYDCCRPKIKYDEDNDIEFLSGDGEYVELYEKEFMILYPSDAHKPSISISVPSIVRKAVVKVRI